MIDQTDKPIDAWKQAELISMPKLMPSPPDSLKQAILDGQRKRLEDRLRGRKIDPIDWTDCGAPHLIE